MSRLPPVDFVHCDASAILFELQGLRREVRELRSFKEEVCNLAPSLADLQNIRSEVNDLKQTVDCMQGTLMRLHSTAGKHNDTAPPLVVRENSNTPVKSFAALAGELSSNGISERRTKKSVVPVVGVADSNRRIKTVLTKRSVDIFVSRLDPSTTPEDLQACITDILPDTALEDIICTKLQSKYEQLYSSFYVCVRVDAMLLKGAVDKLMTAESWPSGLLVRRYFRPKSRNGEQL